MPKRRWRNFKLLEIPTNLPSEGMNVSAREPEADYWMGSAYAALGDQAQAKKYWQMAADVKPEPHGQYRRRRGGLTPATAQTYYQALALQKLGQADKAHGAAASIGGYGQPGTARRAGETGRRRAAGYAARPACDAGDGALRRWSGPSWVESTRRRPRRNSTRLWRPAPTTLGPERCWRSCGSLELPPGHGRGMPGKMPAPCAQGIGSAHCNHKLSAKRGFASLHGFRPHPARPSGTAWFANGNRTHPGPGTRYSGRPAAGNGFCVAAGERQPLKALIAGLRCPATGRDVTTDRSVPPSRQAYGSFRQAETISVHSCVSV